MVTATAEGLAEQRWTCQAEGFRFDFWNTECFQGAIPDPKATAELCLSGDLAEKFGRFGACA